MFHAVKDAIDHNVDSQLPFFRWRRRHRSQRANDAGAVKNNVDLPKLSYRRLDKRFHLGFASHIAVTKNGMTGTT
jgi:hypothetical protein